MRHLNNGKKRGRLLLSGCLFASAAYALPDISMVPCDLKTPLMQEGVAAAGKRVRAVAEAYRGTEVYHALYLPTDWVKGQKYPVIVEYAGNGSYSNKYGDVSSGKLECSNLGYGISGGRGFIWLCLPYISSDHQRNQLIWWGDVEATVEYCRSVVPQVCRDYGGDPSVVFLAGFSRGAIACNYIGLHDDEIAALWRGFICHSHYDGVRSWNYAASDRKSAAERLRRLKTRPQFISHEGSVEETKKHLEEICPEGSFTFCPLPYRNHTDGWTLRNIPERRMVRQWIKEVSP